MGLEWSNSSRNAKNFSIILTLFIFLTSNPSLRESCGLGLVNIPYSSPGLMSDCETDERTMVVQLVGHINMETVENWVQTDRDDEKCQEDRN